MAKSHVLKQSLKQIEAQIAKLQAQAAIAKRKEADGVIARIKEAIEVYQITPAQLFSRPVTRANGHAKPVSKLVAKHGPSKKPKSTVKPMYRNPETGETWSGRGTRTRWLSAALKAGKKLEDFRV